MLVHGDIGNDTAVLAENIYPSVNTQGIEIIRCTNGIYFGSHHGIVYPVTVVIDDRKFIHLVDTVRVDNKEHISHGIDPVDGTEFTLHGNHLIILDGVDLIGGEGVKTVSRIEHRREYIGIVDGIYRIVLGCKAVIRGDN
ncbi:MAG TPA: hypothetical protein DCW41_04095 [Clostridiales bacterium]|nr:hypothetical protein [Clostridiales bacterium]